MPRVNGEVVPIGGPNVRLTLALLLSQHSTVVSVDRIADAVWGDDPPPSFVATIQGNVSRLRRLLGPEADLVARAPGYVLVVPPDLVDRGRFESLLAEASGAEPAAAVDVLDRALACWRGRAFEEFEDRDWARGEAVRLEELHLVATEQLFEARLALGEHRAIVGELERQVVEHPLRERFWRQLMLALYRVDSPMRSDERPSTVASCATRWASIPRPWRSISSNASSTTIRPSRSSTSHHRLRRRVPPCSPTRRASWAATTISCSWPTSSPRTAS